MARATKSGALTYAAEALALCEASGDRRSRAFALIFLDRAEEALALFAQLADRRGMALAHYHKGVDAWQATGDAALANTHLAQARALYMALGDTARQGYVLMELASAARDQEDFGRADTLFREGLALYRQAGDPKLLALNLNGFGELAMLQSDYAAARERLEHSIELFRRLGDEVLVATGRCNLGYVAQHQGDEATMESCLRETCGASGSIKLKAPLALRSPAWPLWRECEGT